jgi:hypothetical protein
MRDENPASVVRTPRDERLWRKAKESAARQGRAGDWAYVMGIFQHMKHRTGSEPVGNPDDDADDIAPEFQLSASRVQQGLFAESAYEAKAKKPKKQPPSDTRQVDMFGLPIDDPPKKNPLTDLEADLSPEELAAFESMILRRYDYSIQSFPNVTPREARLALLFREALRDQAGDYGWRAIKAVPAEHVSRTLRPGSLALIFEDVSQDADEVQFSDGWHEIEQVVGASLQSYNSWSAYVTDNARENPASVTDITGRIAARRRERRTAALASMYDTMAADPGFQQAARRRRAEETMQRHAAGPQLFKRGDRVTYAGADGAIPASWRGRVAVYEWHPEWSDDSDGHFYTVRWTTPEGATHEGVHHQSDLR